MVGGRFRVTTAAGALVSGGKVRIYNAGTTTLTSVYSDSGLSVALTNPVVAASDGWTPQIFCAEGTLVDVDFLTSGSVVIAGQSLVNAIFTGASSTSLTRDFTTSRFQVRGAAGTTHIETGDATGDDTGGTGRYGGWNGTQGDSASWDYLTTDFTGTITESTGKQLDGVVATAVTAFTAVATVDIALPNSPAGVIAWDIDVFELLHSADSQLQARLSYDTTPTFKSGATDYSSVALSLSSAGTVLTTASSQAFMALSASESIKGGTNRGLLRMRIVTVTSGTNETTVESRYCTIGSATGGIPAIWTATNWGKGGYTKATYIRLLPSAGTISGKYRVVPRRGFA